MTRRPDTADRATFTRREAFRALAGLAGTGTLLLNSPLSRSRAAWANEDPPGKRLLTRSRSGGYNGEPALDQLISQYQTPLEQFFIRSHAPNPVLSTETYRLSIEGLVRNPRQWSLAELDAAFTPVTTWATLTCAGNRRTEFNTETSKVSGVPWQSAAIGHTEWSGYRLSQVLRQAELLPDAKYVWFDGLDPIPHKGQTEPFGASIPISKFWDDTPTAAGALLAHQMQGQPLTPDHGFPLRTLVPGYIGARSVKWLGRVIVSDRPSPNRFVTQDYKLLYSPEPEVEAQTEPILEYCLNSAIGSPTAGTVIHGPEAWLQGYALPSGVTGRRIAAVEVSSDGGRRWQPARITSPQRDFSWVLWEAKVTLPIGQSTWSVRATDDQGATQPARVPKNLKAYQFNSWHHVTLTRLS
jgi:sulfite oxidase